MFRLLTIVAVLLILTAPVGAFAQKEPGKPETKPAAARPKLEAQAAVAAKNVTFATIPATDPKVKGAMTTEDLTTVRKLMGKEATFVGTVTDVFQPRGNSVVLLNFSPDYRSALAAVVQNADFTLFPDLMLLKGKRVLMTGKIIDYKGRPELELTRPAQLRIIP